MNDDITKKDVVECIEKVEKSTFLNRTKIAILGDNILYGDLREDHIYLWKPNYLYGRRPSVIKFTFDDNDKLIDVSPSSEHNSKFVFRISILTLLVFLSYYIFENGFSFASLILPCVAVILFSVGSILFRYMGKYEAKQQKLRIFDIIGIEYSEEKQESEYTLSKLFIRLLMYPLAITLLTLFIYLLKESFFLGLIGIILISIYLVSDILLLIKNSKK